MDAGIELQSRGCGESAVRQRPLPTKCGGGWRTGRLLDARVVGHFPNFSFPWGREGSPGEPVADLAASVTLSLYHKSQKRALCLHFFVVNSRVNFPCFLDSSHPPPPPLISAQRGSWQDGGSPPEDLEVLAGLLSSRGRCCPPECVLPARFLPVVAENASCRARHGGVLSGWAGPSAVSGKWAECLKFMARPRIRCVGRAPRPANLSLTRTSLYAFLDSFTHVREGVPLLPRGPGACFYLGPSAAQSSAICFTNLDQQGGPEHGPWA